MATQEDFTQKIEASQERFKELLQLERASGTQYSDQLKKAFEELQVVTQELLVADAELLQQNEELAQVRDKLEAERQRYRDLFEFAPDGYLVTNSTGVILEANRAASRLINVEANFLIGKLLVIYIAVEDRNDFNNGLQKIQSQPPGFKRIEDWEIRLQPRNLEPIFVSLTAMVAREGLRWVMKDIRQRKQMQGDLEEVQGRLVGGREKERLKLAQELHDGPLQDLYGLVFRLNLLASPDEQGSISEEVHNIVTSLQGVIVNLRSLLGNIRPPSLTSFGLEKAIHSHAEKFNDTSPDLKIYLDLIPDRQTLPENMRLALFRIYQHVLMNVAQHAQASQVWIRLTFDDHHQVRMEIQDNGTGFDVPEGWVFFVRQGHLGLARAAEQAASIGGKLIVESEPGNGTTVQVTAPLPD